MIISGKVKNSSGETIPGASIFVSDENGNMLNPVIGVNSDINGNYTINVSTNDKFITASFVGTKKQTKQLFDLNGNNDFQLQSNDLSQVEIIVNRPLPWQLIIAVLLSTVGVSYFIWDISKIIK